MLIETSKPATIHLCSHMSMQVCVEEESSLALNNNLYSHLKHAQPSKLLYTPASRLAFS